MLKLSTYEGEVVSVINPVDIVSVSVASINGGLLVETKDTEYLCDFMSPVDQEVLEI